MEIYQDRKGSIFSRVALAALLGAAAVSLSGCMALALAPLAPMVGGLAPSDNRFVFDESTITPEVRRSLKSAHHIAILNGDRSDAFMAEYLERSGAFEVSLLEAATAATPSQRRKAIQAVCQGKERPDLVFSASNGESDANGGTTLKGALIGRVDFNVSGVIDMLRCSDGWKSQLRAQIQISQGIFNGDSTRLSQEIGKASAQAILKIAEKL